jgi:hypothetical protein
LSGRETDIDRLYGLEPVIEPGDDAQAGEGGSEALESFADVGCPYCGEIILVRVDLSAGAQSYIEDCQVCCQPIELSVSVDAEGQLADVRAARLDR